MNPVHTPVLRLLKIDSIIDLPVSAYSIFSRILNVTLYLNNINNLLPFQGESWTEDGGSKPHRISVIFYLFDTVLYPEDETMKTLYIYRCDL